MPHGHDNNRRTAGPRLLPGAQALPEGELTPEALDRLAASLTGPVVAACAEGHGRGQGLAALLRSRGIAAEYVDAWGEVIHWRAGPLSLQVPVVGSVN